MLPYAHARTGAAAKAAVPSATTTTTARAPRADVVSEHGELLLDGFHLRDGLVLLHLVHVRLGAAAHGPRRSGEIGHVVLRVVLYQSICVVFPVCWFLTRLGFGFATQQQTGGKARRRDGVHARISANVPLMPTLAAAKLQVMALPWIFWLWSTWMARRADSRSWNSTNRYPPPPPRRPAPPPPPPPPALSPPRLCHRKLRFFSLPQFRSTFSSMYSVTVGARLPM